MAHRRRGLRCVARAQHGRRGPVVILYLPWIGHVRGKSLAIIASLEPLTAHNVAKDVPRALVGYPYASLRAIPTVVGLVVIAARCALGVAYIVVRRAHADRPPHPLLVCALAAATPVGVLISSMLGSDIWVARGLYASLPAASLMVGFLLVTLPPPLRIVTAGAVLAVLIAGSLRAVSSIYARPAFRTVAQYLDHAAGPGDPIFMYPSFLSWDAAIPPQLERRHRLLAPSPATWRAAKASPAAFAVIDDATMRAWRLTTLHPAGFALVSQRHYSGLVSFSVFTYRRATAQPG